MVKKGLFGKKIVLKVANLSLIAVLLMTTLPVNVQASQMGDIPFEEELSIVYNEAEIVSSDLDGSEKQMADEIMGDEETEELPIINEVTGGETVEDLYETDIVDSFNDSEEEIIVIEEVTATSNIAGESVPAQKYLSDFKDASTGLVKKSVGYNNYYFFDRNERGDLISVRIEGATIAFKRGILAHADADLIYDLGEGHNYKWFSGYLGVDTSQRNGNVKFIIKAANSNNNTTNWTELDATEPLTGAGDAYYVKEDISGYRYLRIIVDKNGHNGNDHSVIANGMVFAEGYDDVGQDIVKRPEEYEKTLLEKFDSVEAAIKANTLSDEDELLLQRYSLLRKARFISVNQFLTEANNAEKNREFMRWFFNSSHALRMFNEGGEPDGNNYVGALQVMQRLYEAHPEAFRPEENTVPLRIVEGTRGQLYERMAYAIALTHANGVKHWQKATDVTDPVARYEMYKKMYERYEFNDTSVDGQPITILLQDDIFERLEVEEMRWVVNADMFTVEIPWLNWYAYKKYANQPNNNVFPLLYSPHHNITYTSEYDYSKSIYRDPARKDEWNAKYKLDEFQIPGYNDPNLDLVWHVFEEGSVCGGIAKTGTNKAQAFGVPATVINQPGHAAFLVYYLDENKDGAWRIDNDVSGWTKSNNLGKRMPLDWGTNQESWNENYRVSYITMAQAALNDYDNYIMSERFLTMAELARDPEIKERMYEEALKKIPYHMEAWVGLIALKIEQEAEDNDLKVLVDRITREMVHYPLAMYDVSSIVVEELTKRSLTNAASQIFVVQCNMARNAALNTAATYTNNSFTNADAAKVLSKYLLGEGTTELATFSFDGENAGYIEFADSFKTMEFKYSIEGEEGFQRQSYVSATERNGHMAYKLSEEEMAAITAENGIIIIVKGMNESDFEKFFRIDITPGTTPQLYANDNENRLIGNLTQLEYKLASDRDWTDLSVDTTFEGSKQVDVRIKASGTSLAGNPISYTFTEDSPVETRLYVPIRRQSIANYSTAQGGDNNAIQAIDGDPKTFWHSDWNTAKDNQWFITIQFDAPLYLSGVNYIPRPGGGNGRFRDCHVFISMDNEIWEEVAYETGWPNNGTVNSITFEGVEAKYVKLKTDNGQANFASGSFEFFQDITKLPEQGDTGSEGAETGTGEDGTESDSGEKGDEDNDNPVENDDLEFNVDERLTVTVLGGVRRIFTGSLIKPEVMLTMRGRKLKDGVDYTVSYKNNINVPQPGVAPAKQPQIVIKGKKNYVKNCIVYFEIIPKYIGADDVIINASGRSINKIAPIITYNNLTLSKKDYTFDINDKDETITLTGVKNYIGNVTVGYTMAEPQKLKVSLPREKILYDGKEHLIKPIVTCKHCEPALDEDYKVIYDKDMVNAGKHKITVIGLGEHAGINTLTTTIATAPKGVVSAEYIGEKEAYTYTPVGVSLRSEDIVVSDSHGNDLIEGRDYKLSYKNNKRVGNATCTVKYIGNYKGNAEQSFKFEIEKASLDNVNAVVTNVALTKSSVKVNPKMFVLLDGMLISSKEYSIKYYLDEKCTTPAPKQVSNSGTLYAKIESKGKNFDNDSDMIVPFLVARRSDEGYDFNNISVSIPAQEYTGEEVIPEFRIYADKNNSVEITSGYDIEVINNINPGNATVIINGVDGNCGGKIVRFKIESKSMQYIKNIYSIGN